MPKIAQSSATTRTNRDCVKRNVRSAIALSPRPRHPEVATLVDSDGCVGSDDDGGFVLFDHSGSAQTRAALERVAVVNRAAHEVAGLRHENFAASLERLGRALRIERGDRDFGMRTFDH